MSFYLISQNNSFSLKSGMNVIGRIKTADIQIKDPHVSRRHLSIDCLSDNSFTLMDLGSSNGLYVKGRKVPNAILAEGDTFIIGKTKLTLSAGSPESH